MNRGIAPQATRHLTRHILRRLERFLTVEAASGMMLLGATAVALLWANSPWAHSYQALWQARLALGHAGFVPAQPLHFWVNDGLMTIFFLVVGLEIRRELHDGALCDPRIATLPVVSAIAGVIVPALIYIVINSDSAARRGWAVPTATDIAFAVGVLALLGKRVPAALRMLLLTLAIIDDIAAILVIAFYYSNGIGATGILIAACGVLAVLGLQRLGVRAALAYVLPGLLVWLGMLRAGVHPTLAGVVLGLLTPATTSFGGRMPPATAGELPRVEREIHSPAARVQTVLHPWVAYGILPVFALANAGVSLKGLAVGAGAPLTLACGVVMGLVLGKPLGIILVAWIAVRLGLCALPEGVAWRHIVLLGCLGGIGFTMSIFIADVAFPDPLLLETSKFAVLVGSTVAAMVGLVMGRCVTISRPRRRTPVT